MYNKHVCGVRFTTMAITGLVAGKQYEFRVYAENIYGRSEPSEPTGLVQTKQLLKKEFKKKEYPGNHSPILVVFYFPLRLDM
jgi:hypothetical protein